MTNRFWIVDAFAEIPFSGNPASVVLLTGEVPERYLQAVAREFNLSETAFLRRASGENEWSLRWFTPSCEVDLCGHATLAAAMALADAGEASDQIVFHTRSGPLFVNMVSGGVEMDFPALPFWPSVVDERLAGALGVRPVAQYSSTMDVLVEIESAQQVALLAPRMDQLSQIACRGVIATAVSDSPGIDFVSRFFAPRAGVPEDPVTGSAHCLLGPFWSARLGRDRLVGRQVSARPGTVGVRMVGDRVTLAGSGRIVARGELTGDS